MHQKISEFPTFDTNSMHKLKRTGDRKLVDWWLDIIGMYSLKGYLLKFNMGCHATGSRFGALHLMSIGTFITMLNTRMPTK